ncbi:MULTISPECIES: 2-oxo-4-hydroxy-4-carboxy-5-ureidoimidazoline decarboxylase [unclassified Moritella]|uniref:2-oxo-4-hydroxy-4-carboxy-5-ureidoimidazoline decarboxylase n=1 Tax=unclassified Moritella TaxID=2637987 RepID=UPI001BA6BBD3|nr:MULTISPECIES: 2-oxo-4-hydroxy-4-carboxy-5-ureidoimidazoline decarboxylase [unclassified Moritella]QUM85922.1 2-oxo-4-hydroxy-4-carboxy-5-ureidoimidazoline decarboxylase [Moritella sp. 28]QUM90153.1 2-oxo-4-hydroxy-4-carboxy-5-ureidoimidazoline decarboxylase [Moritella sp. 36]
MTRFNTCIPSQLSQSDFVAVFADIYEHSPWVAEEAYQQYQQQGIDGDINNIATLQQCMADILLAAAPDQQLALINAHPDLAGSAAVNGELTSASTSEQAGAGIDQCTAEEFTHFTQLNDAYKAKFNFPFIKAVRGANRFLILADFKRRIQNNIDTEFKQALLEINKIAAFRLNDL